MIPKKRYAKRRVTNQRTFRWVSPEQPVNIKKIGGANGKKQILDDIQKTWCKSCTTTTTSEGTEDYWFYRFIALQPWTPSYLQKWLDEQVVKDMKDHGRPHQTIEPLKLLPSQYNEWIANMSIRSVLITNIVDFIKRMECYHFGPFDFKIVLQLCFDLDLPQHFETIQTFAKEIANKQKWPVSTQLLLEHIF